MPPKSLQLNPHCLFSRYQLSQQSHFCFLKGINVEGDFILGINSEFYDFKESFNPIAYGILPLSHLLGWDFYPTPQKAMLKSIH